MIVTREWAERPVEPRRRERLPSEVFVLVYGRAADNSPFHDIAPVLSVHAHGGTLALGASVQRGQTILLVNNHTQEERECRIVYIGSEQQGKKKVCIEFTRPAANFWKGPSASPTGPAQALPPVTTFPK